MANATTGTKYEAGDRLIELAHPERRWTVTGPAHGVAGSVEMSNGRGSCVKAIAELDRFFRRDTRAA